MGNLGITKETNHHRKQTFLKCQLLYALVSVGFYYCRFLRMRGTVVVLC